MLRLLGNTKRVCDGTTRREFLVAGGMSGLGLGMAGMTGQLRAANAVAAEPPQGKAKSVICLFLFGGWSQLETFDMKPNAAEEIRGPYKPIASSVPGLQVCEHLPLLSQRMHRMALIRSMTTPDPSHNTARVLTGFDSQSGGLLKGTGINPAIAGDKPFFMSALQYLGEHRGTATSDARLPPHLCLPNRLGLLEGYNRTGPYGGILGSRFDPLCTQFGKNGEHLFEPGGVNAETLSFVPDGAMLHPEITLDRLDRRRSLLEQVEAQRRDLVESTAVAGYAFREEQVMRLLTSDRIRDVLDLNREPADARDRYGWNLFGQSVLLSRRLVENGVPLVTAIWDCTKESSDISMLGWDTHWDHFKACEGWLLPGIDRAISSLLDDLTERGLLDETLVVIFSEMGRTPRVNSRSGRDHWTGTFCALLAGGGTQSGAVYGSSDAIASYVAELPVDPQDLLATVYHSVGYGNETMIYDNQNRPTPLYGEGHVIESILT
ncbi:MAG: DUF1501 domain-containing protein [Planctomycetaceae bacterium]